MVVSVQNIIVFCAFSNLLLWYRVFFVYVPSPNTFPRENIVFRAGSPRSPDRGIHSAEPPLFFHLVGLSLVAERGFTQALPVRTVSVGRVGGRILVGGSCGL